jgi:hypothetical protein
MDDFLSPQIASRPRLLIIELDYHAEVLATLCPILVARFELVLWTTDKIWKKTGLARELFSDVLVMPKKQPVATYWRMHEEKLRAVDAVYFNTLEKRFAFFADLDFHCPTVVRIHNTNASLLPMQSIDWSPGNLWQIMSYFLRHVLLCRTWHHRERLYRKMSALMLPSKGVSMRMKEALLKRGIHNLSDYEMPFSCLASAVPAVAEETAVFAVTGSVDARRKDYSVLYQALARLKIARPNWRLELVFLGWAKGKEAKKIISHFAELESDTFKVTWFCDYVSQQTFQEQMARTQFLIAPMKLAASHKIHREYYGQTKISGLENDVVRYRRPVIIPQDYTLPPDLNQIALAYSDEHTLCDAVIKMIKADYWRDLTDRFNDLHGYERDAIADDFYKLWQKLAQQKTQ